MTSTRSRLLWGRLARLVARAAVNLGLVVGFMVLFNVPFPWAWGLGAAMFPGLWLGAAAVASGWELAKLYALLTGVTVVGAVTVCPCTESHFFSGPIGGALAFGLVELAHRMCKWVGLTRPGR